VTTCYLYAAPPWPPVGLLSQATPCRRRGQFCLSKFQSPLFNRRPLESVWDSEGFDMQGIYEV